MSLDALRPGDEPHRPELGVWLELPSGLIVGHGIVAQSEGGSALVSALKGAMSRPTAGAARSPGRLRVANAGLAAEVRAHFGDRFATASESTWISGAMTTKAVEVGVKPVRPRRDDGAPSSQGRRTLSGIPRRPLPTDGASAGHEEGAVSELEERPAGHVETNRDPDTRAPVPIGPGIVAAIDAAWSRNDVEGVARSRSVNGWFRDGSGDVIPMILGGMHLRAETCKQ